MSRKPIDPRLVELLKKYGEENTSVWDCHGTWVAYHAAIERMAAKASIVFDLPTIVLNDAANGSVCILVAANMGERREWSFGEVSKGNNKNSYPYAMAEKRAKDRVALKLLGMAGLAYSEEEADDFKASRPADNDEERPLNLPAKPASSASLKKPGEDGMDAWTRLTLELSRDALDVHTQRDLDRLKDDYRARAVKDGWPKTWLAQLAEKFGELKTELDAKRERDDPLDELINSPPRDGNAYLDTTMGR